MLENETGTPGSAITTPETIFLDAVDLPRGLEREIRRNHRDQKTTSSIASMHAAR
jgi:hypothetical protein